MDDDVALAELDDAILRLRQSVERARAAVAKVRRDKVVIEKGRNGSRTGSLPRLEFTDGHERAGDRPPTHVQG